MEIAVFAVPCGDDTELTTKKEIWWCSATILSIEGILLVGFDEHLKLNWTELHRADGEKEKNWKQNYVISDREKVRNQHTLFHSTFFFW